jgi:hypothetical protein
MILSMPCIADIGPPRHRAVQIKADKVCRRSYAAKVLTEIIPRHVMPRHSQKKADREADRIMVRYFFLGQIISFNRILEGKPRLSQLPVEHRREDSDIATARRGH